MINKKNMTNETTTSKKTKQTKKTTSSKKEPVVEKPIPKNEPVVETPEENTEVPEESSEISLDDRMSKLLTTFNEQLKIMKAMEVELKKLKVGYSKSLKNKSKRKHIKRNGTYQPSGFTKAVPVSNDLSEFLGESKGFALSRPKATNLISTYIKAKGLADPENKSIFKADAALKKVLGEPRFLINKKKPELGNGYSYLNLQTYLKPHFMPAEVSA